MGRLPYPCHLRRRHRGVNTAFCAWFHLGAIFALVAHTEGEHMPGIAAVGLRAVTLHCLQLAGHTACTCAAVQRVG